MKERSSNYSRNRRLNDSRRKIVDSQEKYCEDANKDWQATTRPILETFFHARYFLEMAYRYGQELRSPSDILPSGYAALLYLYDLR